MQNADFLEQKKKPIHCVYWFCILLIFYGVYTLASSTVSLYDYLFVYWHISLHSIDFLVYRGIKKIINCEGY